MVRLQPRRIFFECFFVSRFCGGGALAWGLKIYGILFRALFSSQICVEVSK